jgi:hypothetical protein
MMFGTVGSRFWRVAAACLVFSMLAVPSALGGSEEASVDELKGRLADANVVDRPPLCIRISEQQLGAAGRFYVAGDSDKTQAALADVVAFSELARDYAIQSHKHEKQSEIAIRKMARKLADLKHTVSHEDQEPIQNAIEHLQRARDDLLLAMFPKAGKK